jgi:hypothetical protein
MSSPLSWYACPALVLVAVCANLSSQLIHLIDFCRQRKDLSREGMGTQAAKADLLWYLLTSYVALHGR